MRAAAVAVSGDNVKQKQAGEGWCRCRCTRSTRLSSGWILDSGWIVAVERLDRVSGHLVHLQASLASSYENVNLMLQHEAQINTFDKNNGSSPLHDACHSGSLKSLVFLSCPLASAPLPSNRATCFRPSPVLPPRSRASAPLPRSLKSSCLAHLLPPFCNSVSCLWVAVGVAGASKRWWKLEQMWTCKRIRRKRRIRER